MTPESELFVGCFIALAELVRMHNMTAFPRDFDLSTQSGDVDAAVDGSDPAFGRAY